MRETTLIDELNRAIDFIVAAAEDERQSAAEWGAQSRHLDYLAFVAVLRARIVRIKELDLKYGDAKNNADMWLMYDLLTSV